jgi:predicted TPR repeat methyltransferase
MSRRNRSNKSGIEVSALANAPKTAAGAKQLYDSWATTYESALTSWEYPAPRRVAETLRQHGVNPQHARLLDLGCGTGMAGVALRGAGFAGEINGVDISESSLKLASGKQGVYTHTYAGSLDERMGFIDPGGYDAAVSVGVLSYVEEFHSFFSETCRVCRPGAVVVMTHRRSLWDNDYRGVRSASAALVDAGRWTVEAIGEGEEYMPANPDPVERAKLVRLLVWRVAFDQHAQN